MKTLRSGLMKYPRLQSTMRSWFAAQMKVPQLMVRRSPEKAWARRFERFVRASNQVLSSPRHASRGKTVSIVQATRWERVRSAPRWLSCFQKTGSVPQNPKAIIAPRTADLGGRGDMGEPRR